MVRRGSGVLACAIGLSGLGCGADTNHSAAHPGPVVSQGIAGVSAIGTSGLGAAGSLGVSGALATAGSATPPVAGGQSGANAAPIDRAAAGSGGAGGSPTMMLPAAGSGDTNAPICMSQAPAQFALDTSIGGGGSNHKDSEHFALYGASSPDVVLNFMEAAHKCFIEDWCFRTPGLSAKSADAGPYSKTNIYSIAVMNAGGLTYWDADAELAYIHILSRQINDPLTTVHEYGHAITMSEHSWIDQKRTGFWWETVANWVAYSFMTSSYCEDARTTFGVTGATTIIDQMHTLQTVYNQSYTVICNDQNYYQAWPFFTYLTNNPDEYPGLGKMAVPDLMRKYKLGSNETPLHTLDRIASPIKAQAILGRYWARMAYMDIGLAVGQKDFLSSRSSLTYAANLDAAGDHIYKVKTARRPQYGGANITPLKVSGAGAVTIAVTNLGNGLQESNFTATLVIRSTDNDVRYIDLPNGTGQANIASSEEASLVVVNTPNTLYLFDPQYVGSPENVGLNYQVKIDGATPAN
jgi:Family of unknown function (DUF6055)